MIIINKPFIFDEFRNYVFVGNEIIVDINPNGEMILKETIVKDLALLKRKQSMAGLNQNGKSHTKIWGIIKTSHRRLEQKELV